MGVLTYEGDVPSVIPPARLFKAFVLDADNLMIKIAPQAFKNVELIEGDGGPGSIKKITYVVEGSEKYGKHKIEVIDKENFTYSYSIIEGDHLTNSIEKITNEIKLVPSPDGGSICKSTVTVHTIGDIEIPEEQLKAGKEKRLGMLKAIEGYLVANPDAYN